jgi:predicted transcriptional regulator
MTDEDIDTLISAFMNGTRREILRRLILDQSYALEISKWVGVSQQAIYKQLDLLEKANLVSSVGTFPSTEGASRKLYRPTNFSILITDYSRNFIDVRKYDLPFDDGENKAATDRPTAELLKSLSDLNSKLDDLMKKRITLLKEKDDVVGALHSHIGGLTAANIVKSILWEYVDTGDPTAVAKKFDVTASYVMSVVESYLH